MCARMRWLGGDADASRRELDAVLLDPIEKRGQIVWLAAIEDVLRVELTELRQGGAVVVGEDQLRGVNRRAARISPAQQPHRVVASRVRIASRRMLHPGVPSIYPRAAHHQQHALGLA